MFKGAIIFFVVSLIAGFFGFSGVSAATSHLHGLRVADDLRREGDIPIRRSPAKAMAA